MSNRGRLFAALAGFVLTLGGMAATAAEDAAAGEEADRAVAIFAGGCFWCVEAAFDELAEEGVIATISGYTGGHVPNPSYQQVSAGGTGHAESVKVVYNPEKISYRRLLRQYWHNIDPFDAGGQFCDRGSSYRSAIFYRNEHQKRLAEETKAALDERFEKPIATEVVAAGPFYPAEDYHQNYHNENPLRYKFYVTLCGRYGRLAEVWGEAARGHIAAAE